MAYSRSETTRALVRERPGMYIGSTGPIGVLHMTLEVVENAIDLVLGRRANSIAVECHGDGSIEVRDDGPGLDLTDPVVRSFFEIGHDDATADGHSPHVHLWDGGLGLFVINALSERLCVDSVHQGVRRIHEWTQGGDEHHEIVAPEPVTYESGSSIRFWPDQTIFGESKVKPSELLHRLDQLDCLLPELASLKFVHSRSTGNDGLIRLLESRHGRHHWRLRCAVPDELSAETEVDIALSIVFLESSPRQHAERMQLYCNFRQVTEHSAMHRAIRTGLGAAGDTPLDGLNLACSLRMLEPKFSGPTKGKVDDPRAAAAVDYAVGRLLEENSDARSAIDQLIAAQSTS